MKPTTEDPTKKNKRLPSPGNDGGGEGGTSGGWGGGATVGSEESGAETGKETQPKAPARKAPAVHPWRKYRGKSPRTTQ